MKIRERARELQMLREKESVLHLLVDFFAIPIIEFGKWLSNKWKQYNAISLFFSAAIDMPFQTFTEFLEQRRYFLKEKKEEIH